MKKIIFSMLLFFLWTQTGYAHHLWVVKEDGKFTVARGHMPDRFDAYSPECVKEVKAFDKNGNLLSPERKDEETRAVFVSDKDAAMITVRCDWGFRVNTTQGKKLISRKEAQDQGLKVIKAFFPTQFLKSVFGNSEGITKPAGLKLELIPLKNPFLSSPEELLPVELRFDGNPLADAALSYEGASEEIKTDKNGIAMIKIPEKGIRMIFASHKMPVTNNPEMDYHLFTTFLVIEGE
ncbi:MAG: DUF4198 domain-containing protein [Desulfococcaceae bacterium]